MILRLHVLSPKEGFFPITLVTEMTDYPFKARTVFLILNKKPEEAIKHLSSFYKVQPPRMKIGMPKGNKRKFGCYIANKKTIYFYNQDAFYNPYVVLHEFYHHLRSVSGKHKGSEKLATSFAKEFLKDFMRTGELFSFTQDSS
jgi:hypothetical protein